MTDAMWQEAQKKAQAGATVQELADEYGISYDYMHAKVFRFTRSTDYGKAQVLRDAGWKIPKIANELNTTETAILTHTYAPKPRKKYENEWNAEALPIMKHNWLI